MYTFNEDRTVLVKITSSNLFNQNSFIELFLDNAPLEYLRDHVFGIATYNYSTKIFSINFIPETPSAVINDFLQKYQNPGYVTTLDGNRLQIQTNTPPKPKQMVTLYPMLSTLLRIN